MASGIDSERGDQESQLGSKNGPGTGRPEPDSQSEPAARQPNRSLKAPRTAQGSKAARAREPHNTLQGTIEVVSFHNEENLYSVLRLSPEPGFGDPDSTGLFQSSRVTVVGNLSNPSPGLRLRLSGRWGKHPQHGRQFEIEGAEELPPLGTQGLIRYLASQQFEGVGLVLAERIVERLGARTLEIIRDEPQKLDGIRGLTPRVRDNLVNALHESQAAHASLAFLREIGLGPQQSADVLHRLGSECESLIRKNPYVLTDISGFGFRSADRLALELKFAKDGPERCEAALQHTLEDAAKSGHTMQPEGQWITATQELLALGDDQRENIERAAESLFDHDFVRLTARVGSGSSQTEEQTSSELKPFALEVETAPVDRDAYLPWLHASETGLAKSILRLFEGEAVAPLADEEDLADFESDQDMVLDPLQREAVLGLLAEPIGLLTGGPGVGKTTIVRAITRLAQRSGARVALASPTGRAAKRLSEATDQPASTIHRLLGFEPGKGGFQHDERKPLEAELVIVDEISMLDVALAHRLFKAIQAPTRVVLVGDPDQLPSVGPGQVLLDLLRSPKLPRWRLTQIFRQKSGSRIVSNAHGILRGEKPQLPERGDLGSDFYFFPSEDVEQSSNLVVDVASRRIPKQFGIPFEDVQVLAPMYRGPCGVDALNERLREAQGTSGEGVREVRRGDRIWRTGDRVLHTKNDYERGVFNGDVGRIENVTANGELTVRFPERKLDYAKGEISDLTPAFAMTVHRSQGGEYPAVVLPLVRAHSRMLQRNLLYTAVTRAKRLLVIVGSHRALEWAVANAEVMRRMSRLSERID